jgi:hypothetical protein
MQNFADSKVQDALDLVRKNSRIAPATIDHLQEKILEQMEKIFPVYGKTRSYVYVKEKTIQDILARRFYILRFEDYYLKFVFTLYNSEKGWTITTFDYNEDVKDVFE